MKSRPPAANRKYLTLVILLTVVVAIFLWTFKMHW